jgi:hypothetical protein
MDVREAILARLVEIAEGIDGITRVTRNEIDLSEVDLPAIAILDGDEMADEADAAGRGPLAPRRMSMTPQMVIMLASAQREVGSTLNGFRALLVHGVTHDDTLTGMTTNGRGARLLGTQTNLAWGRSMKGEMSVQFEIPYILRPDHLVDVTA